MIDLLISFALGLAIGVYGPAKLVRQGADWIESVDESEDDVDDGGED